MNFKASEYLSGFIGGNLFIDENDDFESEWEEAYATLQLTEEFSVRGGRFLNRFGINNHKHLHTWDFVNSHLSTSIFLGEESLRTDGLEFNWIDEGLEWSKGLSVAYGSGVEHGHGEEEEEEEHGHGAENAYLMDDIITSRAFIGYRKDDFYSHQFGVNYATGENGYERDTDIWSFDYQLKWRENGLENGGKEWAVIVEYMIRDVEWLHDENPANQGNTSENVFAISGLYQWNENWQASLRYEDVQGAQAGPEDDMGEIEFAFESPERQRVSAAVTRFFDLGSSFTGICRLQYNHDQLEDGDKEDSVFLQVGFDFGSEG